MPIEMRRIAREIKEEVKEKGVEVAIVVGGGGNMFGGVGGKR